MNAIKEINRINQRELELGLAAKGSWHDEYKDSAYIFVGGLSYDLTEGDVITIFSQWGEIVDINLPRDKATGKTKGFGFVMFEDQRSTVLAVDNMNGAQVLGRTIRVDHCRKYNQPGQKNKEGEHVAPEEPTYNAMPPIIEGSDDSESESEEEADDIDDEDPMAVYLRAEKKKERDAAKAKAIKEGKKRKHDGETKEERRARKDAKRFRKAEKEMRKRVREEFRGPSGGRDDKDRKRDRSERDDTHRSERSRHDDRPERSARGHTREGDIDSRSSREPRRDDRDYRDRSLSKEARSPRRYKDDEKDRTDYRASSSRDVRPQRVDTRPFNGSDAGSAHNGDRRDDLVRSEHSGRERGEREPERPRRDMSHGDREREEDRRRDDRPARDEYRSRYREERDDRNGRSRADFRDPDRRDPYDYDSRRREDRDGDRDASRYREDGRDRNSERYGDGR